MCCIEEKETVFAELFHVRVSRPTILKISDCSMQLGGKDNINLLNDPVRLGV